MKEEREWDRPLIAAMVCCGLGLGSSLGLLTVRDALMLEGWGRSFAAVFPLVRMGAAVVAVVAGLAMSRLLFRVQPAWLLPRAFCGSAAVLMAAWLVLVLHHEKIASVLLFGHMAVFNLALAAAFWSMINERYGPRGTRRVAPTITAAAAFGSLFSVLVVYYLKERTYLLPLFVAEHLVCALITGMFAVVRPSRDKAVDEFSGILSILENRPYLRQLAALLFLASTSAFLLNYGLQLQVKASVPTADNGITAFMAKVNFVFWLVTFAFQTLLARPVIQRLGAARSVSVMHFSVLGMCAGTFVVPGLASICALRGSEPAFRNSLFRAGYEILFAPIPPNERNAAKSAIDVCADSLGDFCGAALLLLFPLLQQVANLRWNIGLVAFTTVCGLVSAAILGRGQATELAAGIVRHATREEEDSAPLWLVRKRTEASAMTSERGGEIGVVMLGAALTRIAADSSEDAAQLVERASARHPGYFGRRAARHQYGYVSAVGGGKGTRILSQSSCY